jgi:predicted transglutaminase-like cysteine proteinase
MRITLNDDVWALMNRVNDQVNKEPYKADLELYGRAEFWTIMDGHGGDCEDFALTKRKRLWEAGLNPAHLLPAIGKTAMSQGHCVLLVDTDKGAYVLDNIEPRILAWNDPSVSIKQWIERASDDGIWRSMP